MGSCFQLHSIMFMLLLGLDHAATTRVANELGRQRPKAAKKSLWIATALAMGIMAGLVLPLVVWRHAAASFFSHDKQVVDGVCILLPCYAIACTKNKNKTIVRKPVSMEIS